MPALTLRLGDNTLASGQSALPDARVGDPADYWGYEVLADAAWTLTSGRAWLTLDGTGVPVAIAVPDGTARPLAYTWSINSPSLTYAAPATAAAGLALPNLPPGTKTLIVVRWSPATGGAATPQRPVLRVDGTWTL